MLEPGRYAQRDRWVISKWVAWMCLGATFAAGLTVGAALMAWALV